MSLILNNKELSELMELFYDLTGLKIVLFDDNYSRIASYPENTDCFCSAMRCNKVFDRLCFESDAASFKKCRKSRSLIIYKCHAGLIEATAPIIDDGAIIGYMMFGQFTDNKNKSKMTAMLKDLALKYEIADIDSEIKKIRYKSEKQIIAAAKTLEIFTSYIKLKDMVRPNRKKLFVDIEKYIDKHLSETITVNDLCNKFHISRTQMYLLTEQYTNGGLASFIREKKLNAALDMIKNTDYSLQSISDKTGFCDYNYFLRVFKKKFGISPIKMRK